MEKYVNYLIADLRATVQEVPATVQQKREEGEPFLSAEEEEENAPREPLAQCLGVNPEWFPPRSRLSEQQVDRILSALNRCLHAYGFVPNFPMGLPLDRQYEVIVGHLPKSVPVLTYNAYQIDFCDYEPKGCPFGNQFCHCKVYEQWLTDAEEEGVYASSRIPPILPPFLRGEEEWSVSSSPLGDVLDNREWDDDDDFFPDWDVETDEGWLN